MHFHAPQETVYGVSEGWPSPAPVPVKKVVHDIDCEELY